MVVACIADGFGHRKTINGGEGAAAGRVWVAAGRTAVFFGLWLVISGLSPADLPVGLATAAAATWTSLRLLPPGTWRLRPLTLAGLVLHFVRQSAVAGADVAWRALDPRAELRPGLVPCRTRVPRGSARNAFCACTSLLPGT
jgi:multicomponent Na+:H+ antiporter subunit E